MIVQLEQIIDYSNHHSRIERKRIIAVLIFIVLIDAVLIIADIERNEDITKLMKQRNADKVEHLLKQ